MDDIIQDDLSINLNSVTQTVLDVTTDWIVSSQILSRIRSELKICMTTSVVFHTLDEIVYPAVMKQLLKYVRDVPVLGSWLQKNMLAVSARPYVKVLVQIVTILMLQKYTHDVDIVELTVLMLNTRFIDYVVEINAISDALDLKFDF